MDEKMFQTRNNYVYYKRDDDTWFVKYHHRKLLAGWRCIGSIDLSEAPEEYLEDPELFVYDTCAQLENGPPENFTPYFKVGNHPLTIKEKLGRYGVNLGTAIIEVYKWI